MQVLSRTVLEFKNIRIDKSGPVTTVAINRPEKLNAMDTETREETIKALGELHSDKASRCVILTGAGDRAFCAGQDLSEAKDFREDSAKGWTQNWDKVYQAVMDVPQIVITSTPGYAIGAGWQIYLLGDYRISSENGKFGMNEINDGIACITGACILRSMVGLAEAKRLSLTGEIIDANEALALKLVNKVVPASELRKVTMEVAMQLSNKPPTAVRLQREWFKELIMEDLGKAWVQAGISQGIAFASGEPQELMKAFLQRRRQSKENAGQISPRFP